MKINEKEAGVGTFLKNPIKHKRAAVEKKGSESGQRIFFAKLTLTETHHVENAIRR